MAKKYEKFFKKTLVEQGITDEEAWTNSFEEPENAENFETQPEMPGFQSRYVDKAKQWVSKLDDFADWLNGTEADSLNKQFVTLDREGSPFEGISSHSKKLTSIAEDLAALSETIKGVILATGKEPEVPEGSEQVELPPV